MDVQRYDIRADARNYNLAPYLDIDESDSGEWVRYSDHAAEVSRLREALVPNMVSDLPTAVGWYWCRGSGAEGPCHVTSVDGDGSVTFFGCTIRTLRDVSERPCSDPIWFSSRPIVQPAALTARKDGA